ncbi:MAG: BamA/TamA family outer membrane protein [Leptolyngbyaceae cyanobacterium]
MPDLFILKVVQQLPVSWVAVCVLAIGSGLETAQPGLAQVQSTSTADRQAGDTTSIQYYQSYQSNPTTEQLPPPPTKPASTRSNSPPSVELPPPPASANSAEKSEDLPPPPLLTAPTASVSPASSVSPGSPQNLGEPVWFIPDQLPPAATVPTDTPPLSDPSRLQPAPANQATPLRVVPVAKPASDTKNRSEVALTVTDIKVTGVEPELQETLLTIITTRPGGSVDTVQLNRDIAAILDTGLFDTATARMVPNPQGVTVVYAVTPMIVRSLRLVGARVLTLDVANAVFKEQLDQPVRPSTFPSSVKQLNEWYAQNGYSLARVLTIQPLREGVLVIEVAEGYIGDIKIQFLNDKGQLVDDKGNPIRGRTQIGLIESQIKIQAGQVFQMDRAQEDVARLYQLGVFSNVVVSFAGDARRATIIYNLVERPGRSVNFGGGYSDELGVYATVSFADNNFGGLGQQLSANVQIGLRDIQGSLNFNSPYRETDPGTPGYGASLFRRGGRSLIFEDYTLPNGNEVRDRRFGIGFNLQRPIASGWNGRLDVAYTNVMMSDGDGQAFGCATAPDGTTNEPLTFSSTQGCGKGGIDDLTTIAFTATQDLRDNPTNTGKGSLLTLSTTQTLPLGRGSILGNTLQGSYAYFMPVKVFQPPLDAEFPQVLAFNFQGGTVIGDLPPYNAFTLGGVNSIRGYYQGDVGIGRSYILASAEYRFPIYRFIGGAVFFDVGSILGSGGSVPGNPNEGRGNPGSGFGGGLGVRFNSPLGIIRFDFGINNEGGSLFQFGFGQKF